MKLHWIVLMCLFVTGSVIGSPLSNVKDGSTRIVNRHLTQELHNQTYISATVGRTSSGVPQSSQAGDLPQGCHLDSGIYYHGGDVMIKGVNVYIIFYGTYTTTQQTLITNFIKGLGHSSWYDIERTYRNGNNKRISNSVNLKKTMSVGYTHGQALSDYDIESIVSEAITGGKLPADEQGLYYVLTDTTVTATSGFCSYYCGWHTYATIAGKNIKYSFVGNAGDLCPYSCSAQVVSSPNNDIGVDAMISVIAHELVEAASDPNFNGWFDQWGNENADKCAWTFGDVAVAPNGSYYNIVVNKVNYLIQQLWANAGNGGCFMEY